MTSSILLSPFVFITSLLSLLSSASAARLLESSSLDICQSNSSLTASLFNVVFTPENLTLSYDIAAVSSIQGNVTFDIEATVYGYTFLHESLNPCNTTSLSGLCPMSAGLIDISSNFKLSQDSVNQIPGIAYTVPDLDANVKVYIYSIGNPGVSLACVEAKLSNGQTVYQKGVGWATAVVVGLALIASAVTSGLGYSNTAAHVAANALFLFGYFQAQAIVGLAAVPLPPLVQSWTGNFDWSMGIIKVNFMQSAATWYQKSTGGTPSSLLNTLTITSVQVEKRSIRAVDKRSAETSIKLLTRAHELIKRADTVTTSGDYIVKGMQRVAFRAQIESTTLFLTGLIFFCLFMFFVILFVALFKGFYEVAAQAGWIRSDKFQELRNRWLTVVKGVMYCVILIGYSQMTILCLWEFTQCDSPAEIVLGVFFFLGMTGNLAWAVAKVILTAKRSIDLYENPGYILYSDPFVLNKLGFLYVQFRATAYYFMLPALAYILVKGMFIALGLNSGTMQAVALVIIEAIALIGASVVRPWMDKSTNGFNISICVMNVLNAICLLVFTNVFNLPGLVTGVMGVAFFIINAAFSLVLLILVSIATVHAFIQKNPDARYEAVADDRASFIKSETQLTIELAALGVTARGDTNDGYSNNLVHDEDNESWLSNSIKNSANQLLPSSASNCSNDRGASHHGSSPTYGDNDRIVLRDQRESRQNSDLLLMNHSTGCAAASPGPYKTALPNLSQSNLSGYEMQNDKGCVGFPNQNNVSSWQRGAGYDH